MLFYPRPFVLWARVWKGDEMSSRNKLNKRFLIVILVCTLPLLKNAAEQGFQIFQLHQERVRTEKKVQQLKAENLALEKEKENLGDLHYIEKVAREEHNMVGKDEIPLFMVKK